MGKIAPRGGTKHRSISQHSSASFDNAAWPYTLLKVQRRETVPGKSYYSQLLAPNTQMVTFFHQSLTTTTKSILF